MLTKVVTVETPRNVASLCITQNYVVARECDRREMPGSGKMVYYWSLAVYRRSDFSHVATARFRPVVLLGSPDVLGFTVHADPSPVAEAMLVVPPSGRAGHVKRIFIPDMEVQESPVATLSSNEDDTREFLRAHGLSPTVSEARDGRGTLWTVNDAVFNDEDGNAPFCIAARGHLVVAGAYPGFVVYDTRWGGMRKQWVELLTG